MRERSAPVDESSAGWGPMTPLPSPHTMLEKIVKHGVRAGKKARQDARAKAAAKTK